MCGLCTILDFSGFPHKGAPKCTQVHITARTADFCAVVCGFEQFALPRKMQSDKRGNQKELRMDLPSPGSFGKAGTDKHGSGRRRLGLRLRIGLGDCEATNSRTRSIWMNPVIGKSLGGNSVGVKIKWRIFCRYIGRKNGEADEPVVGIAPFISKRKLVNAPTARCLSRVSFWNPDGYNFSLRQIA